MEQYKKTENLEFDVLYADGTKKHVKNGILFEETEESKLDLHIGTNNQFNMFLAIIEGASEAIYEMTRGEVEIRLRSKEK